jgi:hypothetical protein
VPVLVVVLAAVAAGAVIVPAAVAVPVAVEITGVTIGVVGVAVAPPAAIVGERLSSACTTA